MSPEDDDLLEEMATETAAITAAESARGKAIDAGEQAADSVIEEYEDK